jgi:UDP-N-acetylglucosamine diphosphorylase/glucosamine-1-phosphate N-acetyltransferase
MSCTIPYSSHNTQLICCHYISLSVLYIMDETEIDGYDTMEAVFLAAGEDTRMHPLTCTRPKVMLPIANKPIMEHLLCEVKQAGIAQFVFVVGYYAETVRDYFGNGEKWGVTIEYITQRQQLGTANAVKRTEGRVGCKFLVVNGDVFMKARDIKQLIQADNISMAVAEVTNPIGLGVVEVEGDYVRRIHEKIPKPVSRLVNTGAYLLNDDIFLAINNSSASPRGEYDLTDAIQNLIDAGNEVNYHVNDYRLTADYPWDLLELNSSFLSSVENRNMAEIEKNVTLKGKVSIGEGTQIKAGSYIEGPVSIGNKCMIGPLCYLCSGTAIGNGCQVSSGVKIENSVIMRNTKVLTQASISDSVIGEGCTIGGGTRIGNVRLDGKNVKVAGIDTGRQRMGAIIGDNVGTGVNVSIDAGTLVGNNTIIGPGAKASGVIVNNSILL